MLSPQNLSSVEYETIYHDDIVRNQRIRTTNSFETTGMDGTTILRNTSLSQTTNDFVLSSENFMHRKRVAELADENDRLRRMVESFNSRMSESMIAKGQFDGQLEQLRKADEMRQSVLLTVEQRLATLEA